MHYFVFIFIKHRTFLFNFQMKSSLNNCSEILHSFFFYIIVHKLLIGCNDCPDFLGHSSFFIPTRNTYFNNLFYLSLHVTNYACNTPSNRMISILSMLSRTIIKY